MPENVEIVKRFVSEVVNQGRMETIAEVIHPRYQHHGPDGVEADGPGPARCHDRIADGNRRVGLHNERGEETVDHMLRLYAGHDLVHLAQLDRIRLAVG